MQQAELFGAAPKPRPVEIPGFVIREDYVDAREESELLANVNDGPWETDWRRRIQQYGLGYAGQHGGTPVWVHDFPEWLMPLARRVGLDAHMERLRENCVINEYIPPQGIAPHKDYGSFGPTIACVSLGSDIVMDFKHPARNLRVPVFLPVRSLWVISGPARTEWEHGIAPRLNDVINGERRRRARRVSITFRTARDPRLIPPRF